jgi:hypothetical protein
VYNSFEVRKVLEAAFPLVGEAHRDAIAARWTKDNYGGTMVVSSVKGRCHVFNLIRGVFYDFTPDLVGGGKVRMSLLSPYGEYEEYNESSWTEQHEADYVSFCAAIDEIPQGPSA